MSEYKLAATDAPSPFLAPGVQFAWDSTSLGTFKDCPRKYYYTMIEGWRRKGGSVHLEFGSWYHSGLELYDKAMAGVATIDVTDEDTGEVRQETMPALDHEQALRHVVRELLKWTWVYDTEPTVEGDPGYPNGVNIIPGTGKPWDQQHNLKTRENLIRSVVWYVEQFRDDNAQTVILANGRPAVELSFRFDVDEGLMLSGHLDRVVTFMDSQYVMDRKTASSTISSYYFDQYEPDNQMSLYSYAGQVILNQPVKGVIIDAAQIAVGFTRFERGMTYRTPTQLEEWLGYTRHWVSMAQAMGERMQRLISINKEPSEAFPMNDKSCHDYGGCPFRPICSKDPHVRKTFLESNYQRKFWNPLESR